MATAFRWDGMMNEEELPLSLPAKGGEGSDAHLRPSSVTPKLRSQQVRTAARTRKAIANDFYTVKRIDNTRLVRHIEPVKLRNLYKTVALLGIMAVFCTLYIYQHFRCIDLSFQLEDLKGKQEQAAALNSELRLEKSALRDPHRIDVIAQHQLGLKRPEPTQVREYTNFDGAQVASAQFVKINRIP